VEEDVLQTNGGECDMLARNLEPESLGIDLTDIVKALTNDWST